MDIIPKVIDIDPFHGGKSVRRVGAARSAMRDIGQAPQRPRRAALPHPPGRAISAASGVARRLKCPALRRNSLLIWRAKIAAVKWVNIKEG